MKLGKKGVLFAAAAIVLLAGAYVWLSAQGSEDEGPVQSERKSEIVQITVETAGEAAFCLERDTSGAYGIREYDGSAFKLDQTALQTAFSQAAGLNQAQRVDAEQALSLYGLDAKTSAVQTIDEDGKAEEYWLGRESPFKDGYYMLRKSDGAVMLIDEAESELFFKDRYMYRYGELMPDWDEPAREIQSVKLTREGKCVFSCSLRGKEELDTLVGQAYSRYKLNEPVEASTSTYSMENKLLYPLAALTRGSVVEDDAAVLGPYGLDRPRAELDVLCDQGSVGLLIGGSRGGMTYVMRRDIPAVLCVASDDIQFLLHLGYLDLINDFLWVHNMNDISQARIIAGEERYVLQLQDDTPRLDGEEISETNATRLFLRLISVCIAGDDENAGIQAEDEEAVRFEMQYKDGQMYTLSFFPVNERYYLVSQNEKQTHLLASFHDVDTVLQGIAEIKAGQTLDPT